MKLHYLALVKHIRENLPEIKWIDLYKGQDLNPKEEDPINQESALYIQWGQRRWKDGGAGVQDADSSVIFHLVTWDHERSLQLDDPALTPDPTLKHLALIDKLNRVFQGHFLSVTIDEGQCTLCTDMQRSDQQMTIMDSGVLKETIEYSATFFDYSSSSWYGKVLISLQAEIDGLFIV